MLRKSSSLLRYCAFSVYLHKTRVLIRARVYIHVENMEIHKGQSSRKKNSFLTDASDKGGGGLVRTTPAAKM